MAKLGFEPKDWVTAILSVAALVVSGYTFYATEVEVKDDVRVRIVRWGLDPEEHEDTSNLLGLTLAIINVGNRQAALINSRLTLEPRDKPSGLAIDGGKANRNLPMLIEPKKILLLTPRMDISSVAQSVLPADRGANGHRLYTLNLELEFIDSKGRLRLLRLPVEIVDYDLQLRHIFLPLEQPGGALIPVLYH